MKERKAFFQAVLPSMLAFALSGVYAIVDGFFLGHAMGDHALAAVNMAYPITAFLQAVGTGIGMGGAVCYAISLGRRRIILARKYFGMMVLALVACGIGLTVLFLTLAPSVLSLFGAQGTIFALGQEYLRYISFGALFQVLGTGLVPLIRNMGGAVFAMAAMIAGFLTNILLDWLLVWVVPWGMMGAAVATVIGQVLTAALSVWYLCRMKAVKLQRSSFAPKGRLIARFLPLGLCSLLSQISMVAAMAAINNMLRRYGAADPVFGQPQYAQIPMAVVGIVMKFFQIVISVAIGLAAGCIPIVGYNIGAGRRDRARSLFTHLLVAEAVVGAVALLIVEIFPRPLISVFGAANESVYYTEFAAKCFRTYLCMLILACVNKGTFIYLQSLGKALASTVLSMVREVVFGVGLALLLPVFFGLDGVLYSMPAADILTFFLSAFLIVRTYRALKT